MFDVFFNVLLKIIIMLIAPIKIIGIKIVENSGIGSVTWILTIAIAVWGGLLESKMVIRRFIVPFLFGIFQANEPLLAMLFAILVQSSLVFDVRYSNVILTGGVPPFVSQLIFWFVKEGHFSFSFGD